jgi:hypothetical protein
MLEALIDLAQAQLAALFTRSGNLDMQALGLVGFDGALAAAVVAAQQVLGYHWWVPLPGLGVSALAGASVMAVTRFDLGPAPSDFYERNRSKPEADGLAQLLADLLAAQRHSAEPLRMKTRRLLIALGLLLATVIYSALCIAL